jgi:hypothetical protein
MTKKELKVGDKVRFYNYQNKEIFTIISLFKDMRNEDLVCVQSGKTYFYFTAHYKDLTPVNMGYAVKSNFTDTGIVVFQHKSDAKNYIEKMNIQNATIVEMETDLFINNNKNK